MRKGVRSLLAGGLLAAFVLVPGSPAIAASNVHAMKVYVSYADGVRGGPTLPSPWEGDEGVQFVGGGTQFDAGAIRIVNPSRQPLTIDDVSVDIGSATYDLWGSSYPITVDGKSSVILTQTVEFDFDTSEPGLATCDPTGDIPLVHIMVGSRNPKTRTFTDAGQVLNTGGIDPGACTGSNEGHGWVRVHGHD
ncbi:MAG: hypothetical protein E6G58_12815 [Actinobacteria bacterium]|nr:MAG: hypothetical protein E6G58_12815 [Actinomycetota bacterium]